MLSPQAKQFINNPNISFVKKKLAVNWKLIYQLAGDGIHIIYTFFSFSVHD
jgi:hypothetical protein